MSDVCNKCGLSKNLCVCQDIAKESQKITVKCESRRFGKKYTIIEGIDENEVDMSDLAKKLKTRFACGGTVKDGAIELQGNHLRKAKGELKKLGFPPEKVELKGGRKL